MKYQRSTTFGCKEIEVRKSESVAKTQFLFKACFCVQITFISTNRYWAKSFSFIDIRFLVLLIKSNSEM